MVGAASVGEMEALLLAHAADCPACRPVAARYQALRQAIRAWRRPPEPPANLVGRILSVPLDPTPEAGGRVFRWGRRSWRDHSRRVRVVGSLAARWLIAFFLMMSDGPERPQQADPSRPRDVAVLELHSISADSGGPPPLDRALARATSATWDLARSASEPATRIGRDVLDVTVSSDESPASSPGPAGGEAGLAGLSVAIPTLDPFGPDGETASSVLQQVGDQLSAGVRPLSSSARHAFGFLLGPPPPRAGSRPGGSSSNGARSG